MARRASLVYRLGLTLALLGTLAAGMALVNVLRAVDVEASGAEHLDLLGLELTAPAMNLAGVVTLPLAAVGLVCVLRGLRAGAAQILAQRRFERGLALVGSLPAHPDVLLVRDERAQAFCAGYLRPRVFVSTATVETLGPAELDAVIAHEAQHRLRRDPLRIAAARALCDALFFLPALRRLTERYCALAELSADEAAVARHGGDPAALASAMLSVGGVEDAAVVGIAPERVDHLLGATPGWRLPCLLLASAGASIVTIALLAWLVGRGALITTSLNLPLLSTAPCVLVLAGVPFLLVAAALWLRRSA
jgi:Zn-dependent protease with chaperone function